MSKVSVFFFFGLFVLACGVSANGSRNHGLGIYEIKKGDFSLKVTNYGARIVSVVVPDKNGEFLCDLLSEMLYLLVYLSKDANFFLAFCQGS